MGLSIMDMVIMGTGTVLTVIYLIVFALSLKNKDFFEVLDEDDFHYKDLFCVGYFIMEKSGYQYNRKSDRELRKQLAVLYGEDYKEYYLRVVYSQRVTYLFTLGVVGFIIYGLVGDIIASLLTWMIAGTAFYYFGTETGEKIKKRSEELMLQFSNVVSKLALFINAGMIMKEAWKEVAEGSEGLIYDEMRISLEEMNNGKSEADALYDFGLRCMVPEIKKFTSTIIQGIQKGNSELAFMLQQQSKEVWGIKRQKVKRVGELASGKLMIPIFITFAGILIMVIVPIFANIGM